MARVTVEEALNRIPNRFILVHVAAARARQIAHGQQPVVSGFNNKPIVLALREIEAGHVGTEILSEKEE